MSDTFVPPTPEDLSKLLEEDLKTKSVLKECQGQHAATDAGVDVSATIQVNDRFLQDITANAFNALVAHNKPPQIFNRAGSLVRLHKNEYLAIEPLTVESLKNTLAKSASYYLNTARGSTRVSPPTEVVKAVLALDEWPQVPEITNIIETPVIRPDGSILSEAGYDEATHLYLDPIVDFSSLVIPEELTKKHAEASVKYVLDEIFSDFPFENNASRTNTLALLLSVIVRPMVKGNVPLFILDKPQAGTGASLIADVISTITTGKPASMWGMPDTEDEWRKSITSALINGSTIIVIDNIGGKLKSSSLTRALTSKIWRDRQLGKNVMVDLPQSAVWIATGNNIQIGGDIARRSVWIRLDAACARPWTRAGFKHPEILEWVRDNHDSIIAYLLIMARSWVLAGSPKGSAKLGGFNEWAGVVSGILEYAGVQDFLGNATQLYDEMDQDVQQWNAFLEEWSVIHSEPIKAGQLKDDLTSFLHIYDTFKEAMPDDIATAIDKSRNGSLSLSHVLKKHLNQVYPSGRKLTQVKDTHTKNNLWKVESAVVAEMPKNPTDSSEETCGGCGGLLLTPTSGKISAHIGCIGATTASTADVVDDSDHVFGDTRNHRKSSCLEEEAMLSGPHPRRDEPTPVPKEVTKFQHIRFLSDQPSIFGSDGIVYGPFKKDLVVFLPATNAYIFTSKGYAVEVSTPGRAEA